MLKILSTVACNLDTHLLQATLPLFESEKVEAIEWSFDTLIDNPNIPNWFTDLLMEYSEANRLIGHGVFFSLFSGQWTDNQTLWLKHLEKLSRHFQFEHITEHFGFMTGKNFHDGAPIPIPFTKTTLAIGQDRLKRIQNICNCPVGLENLAFSYSLEEVKKHGDFLYQLIEPINGFIILDLHNLYCQIHNFNIEFEEIIPLYPLDSVREIHISGGSWDDSALFPSQKVRRDTHDDAVPEEVFQLLEKTIPLCPNLKFVVMEQLGIGLTTPESKASFQNDFLRMRTIVEQFNPSLEINGFLPKMKHNLNQPLESSVLFEQQQELNFILENAIDYNDAKRLLQTSTLSNSDWEIENWNPMMLETVLKITKKWKS